MALFSADMLNLIYISCYFLHLTSQPNSDYQNVTWLQSRPKSHDIYEAANWLKKFAYMSKDGTLQITEAFCTAFSRYFRHCWIPYNDVCDVSNSLQHKSFRPQHKSLSCCTQVPWENQNGR